MATRNVPGSYPTIQAAVDAADPFDTIMVAAGYAGNESVSVTVNKLVFSAPFGIVGVSLTAGAGVSAITVSGDSAFKIFGNGLANTLTGGNREDQLSGGARDDTLGGGGGSDLLIGGAGNDSLDGGDGIDVVSSDGATKGVVINLLTGTATDGLGGTDTLTSIEAAFGSAFADTITLGNFVNGYAYGYAGDDKIFDGTADSTLTGGSGNDTLNGGEGFDYASYVSSVDTGGVGASGVSIDLATGTATDNWGNVDSLTGIEGARGSNLADSLIGDANRNTFYGNGGNDTLIGGAGSDFLVGGDGDDTMIGGAGSDYFLNGAGSDTIDGGLGYDFYKWSNAQDFDTVDYTSGALGAVMVNLATGTASDGQFGTDTLSGVESVVGSWSNDTLIGGGSSRFESFRGGAGSDMITGAGDRNTRADYSDRTQAVAITLSGDADGGGVVWETSTSADSVRYVNQFFGSPYADTYDVSAYTLSMRDAANGFNLFRGGAGNDTIIGNGNTRLDFGSALTGISIDLAQNSVADGQGGVDTFSGVNSVVGGAFDDVIVGTDGNETLQGLGGNDTIRGGGGFDEARYGSGSSPVTRGIVVDMKAGTVTGDATFIGTDTLSGIESIQGSLLADTYVATGFASGDETGSFRDGALVNRNYNRFSGLSGNDKITGNGQTVLDYRGSSSSITVSFTGQGKGKAHGAADDVDTFTGVYAINDTAYDDVLTGSNAAAADYWEGFNLSAGNDTVIGGGGDDFISFGTSSKPGVKVTFTGVGQGTASDGGTDTFTGIEFVIGSSGNDLMLGAGGDETFAGLAGDDKLKGGAGGGDGVSYFFDHAGVAVDLQAGTAHDGYGGVDSLSGFEIVFGSSFNDRLLGSVASDTLVGNAGNDTLAGGRGNDMLTGGAGKDKFVFDTAPNKLSNLDHITDFSVADDTIALENAVFSAFTATGIMAASAFFAGTQAHDADDRIIYNQATGGLFYDSNGSASGGSTQIASLSTGLALTNKDFLIA